MSSYKFKNNPKRILTQENLIRSRLARIIQHKALRFEGDQTGYENHVFGGRAHIVDQNNFYHELAHVVEFGSHSFKKRVDSKLGCFIFHSGKNSFALGRYYEEYFKTTALRRELRTIAIQVKLAKMCGVKRDVNLMIEDISESMQWMPDYFNIESDDKMKYCVEYVKSFYETLSENVILARLNAWLDKVEKTKIYRNSL